MNLPNIMHQWFVYLFEQRMDANGYVVCFECGGKMHQDTYKHLTTCYSHILAKAIYTEHAGNEENVKICHPDCHNLYTKRPKQAKNQHAKYIELKRKYYE